MSWTLVSEPTPADPNACTDDRVLSAVADRCTLECTPRSSAAYPSTPWGPRRSDPATSHAILRPTLSHFGLTTANLEPMVEWYGKVLGMTVNHRASIPVGVHPVSGWRTAWLSNDQANHRIAIMALPGLKDDPQRSRHKGIHHISFEFATLDDLLATYARLKPLGLEPVLAADHGATTSFYYKDPDGNSIELMTDNFGDDELSRAFMQTSPAFATNPTGTDVDPEQLIAARAQGMSVAELHERAFAGEFCSVKGFYRYSLNAAANRSSAGPR